MGYGAACQPPEIGKEEDLVQISADLRQLVHRFTVLDTGGEHRTGHLRVGHRRDRLLCTDSGHEDPAEQGNAQSQPLHPPLYTLTHYVYSLVAGAAHSKWAANSGP